MTTAAAFTPTGKIATTLQGKNIFISDIGNKKLSFLQIASPVWKQFDAAGNLIKTYNGKPGTTTPPITNSYYSPSQQKVFIEFEIGSSIVRTELNKTNFDLAPLETLPSAGEQRAAGQTKADQANDLEGKNIFELSLISIFGKNYKLYAGLILAGVIFLPIVLRKR